MAVMAANAIDVHEPEVVSERPLEWIEAEITTLAGHIAAATCRLVVLIGELDHREGW